MILIVDDDPLIREVLAVALHRAGFETAGVGDGLAALREARRLRPELVVLDLGLPHLDGLPAPARRRQPADPGPERAGRRGRAGRGPRSRCRRLRDQALQPPRAPGPRPGDLEAHGPGDGSGDGLDRRGGPAPRPLALDPEAQACRFGEAPVPLTATEMALLARLLRRPDHL